MKATHQPLTTPTTDPMRPSMLLRGAATYLGTHGWTQHQFYDLLADTIGPFPPACTSGAIMTAASGRCLASGMCTPYGDENHETVAVVNAMRVLAVWLDYDYASSAYATSAIDVIGDWNDHDDRTLNEVIECLTDVADDWDRAHPTGGAQ